MLFSAATSLALRLLPHTHTHNSRLSCLSSSFLRASLRFCWFQVFTSNRSWTGERERFLRQDKEMEFSFFLLLLMGFENDLVFLLFHFDVTKWKSNQIIIFSRVGRHDWALPKFDQHPITDVTVLHPPPGRYPSHLSAFSANLSNWRRFLSALFVDLQIKKKAPINLVKSNGDLNLGGRKKRGLAIVTVWIVSNQKFKMFLAVYSVERAQEFVREEKTQTSE